MASEHKPEGPPIGSEASISLETWRRLTEAERAAWVRAYEHSQLGENYFMPEDEDIFYRYFRLKEEVRREFTA